MQKYYLNIKKKKKKMHSTLEKKDFDVRMIKERQQIKSQSSNRYKNMQNSGVKPKIKVLK